MAKLLYITANPKTESESFSLSVGKAFLDAYKQANPNDEIIPLDLYQMDVPEIDVDVFSGWGKLQQGHAFEHLSAEEKRKVSRINELTDQFVEGDIYVFVTPMWNLSVPPRLKTYIDNICVAGKTFKYTAEGSVGLLGGKTAVHIQARGGLYKEGPAKELEFGDRYVRAILNFLGVTSIHSVIAEGMAAMPDKAQEIKEKAIKEAQELAKSISAQTVK